MITKERVREALHNVASEHDPEKAVWALLGEAWQDGYDARHEDRDMYGTTPSPYDEEAAS